MQTHEDVGVLKHVTRMHILRNKVPLKELHSVRLGSEDAGTRLRRLQDKLEHNDLFIAWIAKPQSHHRLELLHKIYTNDAEFLRAVSMVSQYAPEDYLGDTSVLSTGDETIIGSSHASATWLLDPTIHPNVVDEHIHVICDRKGSDISLRLRNASPAGNSVVVCVERTASPPLHVRAGAEIDLHHLDLFGIDGVWFAVLLLAPPDEPLHSIAPESRRRAKRGGKTSIDALQAEIEVERVSETSQSGESRSGTMRPPALRTAQLPQKTTPKAGSISSFASEDTSLKTRGRGKQRGGANKRTSSEGREHEVEEEEQQQQQQRGDVDEATKRARGGSKSAAARRLELSPTVEEEVAERKATVEERRRQEEEKKKKEEEEEERRRQEEEEEAHRKEEKRKKEAEERKRKKEEEEARRRDAEEEEERRRQKEEKKKKEAEERKRREAAEKKAHEEEKKKAKIEEEKKRREEEEKRRKEEEKKRCEEEEEEEQQQQQQHSTVAISSDDDEEEKEVKKEAPPKAQTTKKAKATVTTKKKKVSSSKAPFAFEEAPHRKTTERKSITPQKVGKRKKKDDEGDEESADEGKAAKLEDQPSAQPTRALRNRPHFTSDEQRLKYFEELNKKAYVDAKYAARESEVDKRKKRVKAEQKKPVSDQHSVVSIDSTTPPKTTSVQEEEEEEEENVVVVNRSKKLPPPPPPAAASPTKLKDVMAVAEPSSDTVRVLSRASRNNSSQSQPLNEQLLTHLARLLDRLNSQHDPKTNNTKVLHAIAQLAGASSPSAQAKPAFDYPGLYSRAKSGSHRSVLAFAQDLDARLRAYVQTVDPSQRQEATRLTTVCRTAIIEELKQFLPNEVEAVKREFAKPTR